MLGVVCFIVMIVFVFVRELLFCVLCLLLCFLTVYIGCNVYDLVVFAMCVCVVRWLCFVVCLLFCGLLIVCMYTL